MPEIQSLNPVDLRELWGNEAHDCTPWLVDSIESAGCRAGPEDPER